jgi:hypothetical protein
MIQRKKSIYTNTLLTLAVSILGVLGGGCGGVGVGGVLGVEGGLGGKAGVERVRGNGELAARVLASPHGYFRLINRPFAKRVCEVFGEDVEGQPPVNLHGDAHLEQYAVTGEGHGLTDFDDASVGPAVVDVVRFGVSLRLAGEVLGWGEEGQRRGWEAFLGGYREGLRRGESKGAGGEGEALSVPSVVGRVRRGFGGGQGERAEVLARVDGLMEPLDFDEAVFAEALRSYARVAAREEGEDYYRLKRVGYLRMGVGSALDEKYLFRVEGEGEGEGDDVVLEAKVVRDLGGIPCVEGAMNRGALRVLVGQARIAYQPQAHLGTMTLRGKTFWVHAWEDHYQELVIEEGFASEEEWIEVARDVGVQLGLGHPRLIASPLDHELRVALEVWLERREGALREGVAQLAEEVKAGWEALKQELTRE